MCLFCSYLLIVWIFFYNAQKAIYTPNFSKKEYLLSNLNFVVPVLLPWFFLSIILDILFLIPFPGVKTFFSSVTGELFYFLFFIFLFTIFGPTFVLTMWRCKPLEDGHLRQRIENLCDQTNLKYANILVWPILGGSIITAGIMGLISKTRYILVTRALTLYLTQEEIDSVISHEIGHVKKNHLILYLLFFLGFFFISYSIFNLIIYVVLYFNPAYYFKIDGEAYKSGLISGFLGILLILLFLFHFRYVFGYFIRNFERQADVYAYKIMGTVKHLISTFEKIIRLTGECPDKPNWHHFSIQQRIDYLKKCEYDKAWIKKQDSKIRKSIAVYIAGVLAIGIIGYGINFGVTGNFFDRALTKKILEERIEKKPYDASLYGLMADILQDEKKYAEAINYYEKALSIDPRNHGLLNNFAWMLVTCENAKLKNPSRALALAQIAVSIEKNSEYLDTLSECFFAKRQYEEAINAQKEAISLAQSNTAYYHSQLQKFIEASKKEKF
ncbi:MAG: M48 family metalloprotease [Desulfobacterales bacterium]|nr:M48 family metalloprotease [Desulfobacterales bacterium]